MKRSSAGLVLALVALQLTPLLGAITGIVIKAGTAIQQPLRNARLELTGGAGTVLVTRTDANGKFVFSNLAPGEYGLAVTCDGFIRQDFPKKIVLGRGQQAGNILFELDPAPTAAGSVLDSYGEPIANIVVEALRRSYDVRGNSRLARAATAVTDDRGGYRIFWLDPGEYFFYAASPLPDGTEAQPVRVFAPTYSPGVSTPDDAKPLRLTIGREVRVDFRLQRAALWSVTGQTMIGMTGRSVAATITATPPAEAPSFSRYRAQSSMTPYPGLFSMENVAPGSYILMAKTGSGGQEMTGFQRIVLRPSAFIPPPAPPPKYTVFLKLSPPLSVNGRLFIESRETVDLREANVTLISTDPDLPSPRSVFARPDGQFILTGIVPGSYVLEISNLPQDLYLKAARFGAEDILAKPLTLETREAANPLQILLGSDGGRLQVSAYNDKGETHSGAHFVLVPDVKRRDRREQYRVATSSENGQAVLRGIPPGSYKLFAWEDLEANAYLSSDYLRTYEAFGVPVNISTSDNPPVSARLIPKE
ncbi:MAG TPA: carboxypeptidase-like regulatory domain-containing protein [Terriglobia bacterium]|nr:carboxypeptidase-like regulatory domain-containing protein [Terriglobia bacterium]